MSYERIFTSVYQSYRLGNKCSSSTRLLACSLLFLVSTAAVLAQTTPAPPRQDFRNFDPNAVQADPSKDTAFVGIVYPRQRFLLAFASSGLVGSVPVKEGEQVRAGAPVMVLEQSSEQLELQRLELLLKDNSALLAARSRLELHDRQLKTAEALYAKTQSISLDELTALRMRLVDLQTELSLREVEKARQGLDLGIARSELEKRTIRAPANGYVVELKLKRGEWAQAGDPVVDLVDVSRIVIRLSVAPARARTIKQGARAKFETEGQAGSGVVAFVSPVSDPASGLVEVRIEAENPQFKFRPGVQARVDF
jgi:RND family efflux transporter MFP subunit